MRRFPELRHGHMTFLSQQEAAKHCNRACMSISDNIKAVIVTWHMRRAKYDAHASHIGLISTIRCNGYMEVQSPPLQVLCVASLQVL